MTAATDRVRPLSRPGGVFDRARAFAFTRRGLVTGWAALHLAYALSLLPILLVGGTEGDLPLYRQWAQEALHGVIPVFDEPWVYPAGALVPIMLSILAGPWAFQLVWLVLLSAGNLAALAAITGGFRRRSAYPAAWYWLLIVLLLAPVSMLRLEGAAAPFAIAGLVWVVRRPAVAGVMLAAATWIKVWPAALAAAAVTVARTRTRIIVGGVALSAGIVAVVAIGGGAANILSFATIQTDRALQLEAPVATPWVWATVLGIPGAEIRQNWYLATREVAGPGAHLAADLVGIMMPISVVVLVALLWLARSRAQRSGVLTPELEQRLIVRGAFAVTAALIVFNKVGSPQYMLWLAPVVAVGLAIDYEGWRKPATWMALTCLLTTLIFPILYLPLIDADPTAAGILLLRNGIVIGMFVWSVVWLVKAALPSRAVAQPASALLPQPAAV
ncbi:glycosyltransferase 87 family protein [Microbacterium telephonicum]|uniref:Uncharacterized protein DUF2029 n=1 Tax=Microbacterium telephonicum TaxID=1714841 RepID=A0A498C0G5_9MICO|nr:glycosyltransferase 87 family protein [Microbacterium telephonicum]RLK46620.1 uncharacterized protein DUF2029 [Microbacterium telephonicum]